MVDTDLIKVARQISYSGLRKWRTYIRILSMNAYSKDLRLKMLAAAEVVVPRVVNRVAELLGAKVVTSGLGLEQEPVLRVYDTQAPRDIDVGIRLVFALW